MTHFGSYAAESAEVPSVLGPPELLHHPFFSCYLDFIVIIRELGAERLEDDRAVRRGAGSPGMTSEPLPTCLHPTLSGRRNELSLF